MQGLEYRALISPGPIDGNCGPASRPLPDSDTSYSRFHSINVAPEGDLSPFVARFFVCAIEQEETAVMEDMLLNECAMIQIPIRGEWAWQEESGSRQLLQGATVFGPRSRALRVSVQGSAVIAGIVIRPCGWGSIDTRPAAHVADRIERLAVDWVSGLGESLANSIDSAEIVALLQRQVRRRVADLGASASTKAATFEALVRSESNTLVTEAAANVGMNLGTFDRFVRRHFGHGPKMVLRRSRFLDMAGVLHGVAPSGVDALAPVRFYDASHLNREFRIFVNMTPGGFARAHTPLLNAELEARQLVGP